MKNGQIKNNVKFTKEKSILSKNLGDLMKARNLSVIQLAEKAFVTRQAIYDILNDKSIPRESTLEDLAKALSTDDNIITADLLKNGLIHFDYDYFSEKLHTKFPYHINQNDVNEYLEGLEYEDEDSIDLQGFLVYKFNIDPVLVFVKHCLPPEKIQKEIADYFGFKSKEIFKIYGGFPIMRDPTLSRVNVNNMQSFNNTEFTKIFEQLSLANKKTILNLCMDLLQIQNN